MHTTEHRSNNKPLSNRENFEKRLKRVGTAKEIL